MDREKLLKELNHTDRRIAKIGDSVTDTPEEELWDELQKTTAAFSTEARRLLSVENPTTLLSRDLFRRHEESLRVVAKLAAEGSRCPYRDPADSFTPSDAAAAQETQ